jgi:hypothetical protein
MILASPVPAITSATSGPRPWDAVEAMLLLLLLLLP